MIKVLIFFVILTIISLNSISLGRTMNRFKRADNGYILRSCQASVQLTRQHRTNLDANISKERFENVRSHDDTTAHLNLSKENLAFLARKTRTSNMKQRDMRRGREGHPNTPFKTIDVKAADLTRPLIFRKKDSLPQISRNLLGRKIDTETNIFIVETIY